MEFTEVGCHKYAVKSALELTNDHILVLLCKTREFSTIIKRIIDKKFILGNPFNLVLNKHIYFIKSKLEDIISKNF